MLFPFLGVYSVCYSDWKFDLKWLRWMHDDSDRGFQKLFKSHKNERGDEQCYDWYTHAGLQVNIF